MAWNTCRLMNVSLTTLLEKKDIPYLRWLNDWKSRHVCLFRIREPKPPMAILRVADNPTRRGPRFVVARRDFGDDPLQREVFSDVARDCIRTLIAIYVYACDYCVREEEAVTRRTDV